MILKPSTWKEEVRRWAFRRKGVTPAVAEDCVRFFQHAFAKTASSRRAWFGIHSSAASLVVGAVFLAAIVPSGRAKGAWLLLDTKFKSIRGAEPSPVASAQRSGVRLFWLHIREWKDLSRIVDANPVWASYSRASRLVLDAPASSTDRDAVQRARGKVRLRSLRK